MVGSMLGKPAVKIIRGTNVESAGGLALKDVYETHESAMVGPCGLEPQTSTVSILRYNS
jgi:hypothetical protein